MRRFDFMADWDKWGCSLGLPDLGLKSHFLMDLHLHDFDYRRNCFFFRLEWSTRLKNRQHFTRTIAPLVIESGVWETDGDYVRSASLQTPRWFLTPVLAAYPGVIFITGAARQLSRRKQGRCVEIGHGSAVDGEHLCHNSEESKTQLRELPQPAPVRPFLWLRRAPHWVRLAFIWGLALGTLASAFAWLWPPRSPEDFFDRRMDIRHEDARALLMGGEFEGFEWGGRCPDFGLHGEWFVNLSLAKACNGASAFYFQTSWRIPRAVRHGGHWSFGGFCMTTSDNTASGPRADRTISLDVPCWFVVIFLGIYPAVSFFRGPVRRWHRRRHGRCVKCGYNLTGLPEPRCPECGNAVLAEKMPDWFRASVGVMPRPTEPPRGIKK